jgi:D-beta-D-heptose 7-phosphate kinase/D-beta-D-heptose 1-phosphate adenosyltransferase
MNSTRDKVMCRDDAVAWRRANNGPVVFTNGVFDLLHPGHVELLEQARAFGDSLMVGVNTDASVQRLAKGPGRPLVPGLDRARVLAALAAVDCVVMFDEDTPLSLIEAVQPDVLVKGGDYALDQIVGADLVVAAGGRVERIPLLESFSTTGLVEHIRASSR